MELPSMPWTNIILGQFEVEGIPYPPIPHGVPQIITFYINGNGM